MSQNNLTDARKFVAALDNCRDLCNEWAQPHGCSVDEQDWLCDPLTPCGKWCSLLNSLDMEADEHSLFGNVVPVDPALVKDWEATCHPAGKIAMSIIEKLKSFSSAVVRLVEADGGDSRLVHKWIMQRIDLLQSGPWSYVSLDDVRPIREHESRNEMFFTYERYAPFDDEALLAIGHAIVLAEQTHSGVGERNDTKNESTAASKPALQPASTESRVEVPRPVSSCSEHCFITFGLAARFSGVSQGQFSRLADEGKIKDNGLKGKGKRLLYGGSFLKWFDERGRIEIQPVTESDEEVEKLLASTEKARN